MQRRLATPPRRTAHVKERGVQVVPWQASPPRPPGGVRSKRRHVPRAEVLSLDMARLMAHALPGAGGGGPLSRARGEGRDGADGPGG